MFLDKNVNGWLVQVGLAEPTARSALFAFAEYFDSVHFCDVFESSVY